ncbi:PepSY-associated TM helix domain-containing protein [Nocardia sp. NPDC056100]|uniref:PepSY-associated TM helix domain-containing protein n=1 Tax=Nocardia sp. NPDC056100 TaxID=3345712 RepID=UPI0035DD1BD9
MNPTIMPGRGSATDAAPTPRRGKPAASTRRRSRKPLRRSLIAIHRWSSLILGLLLVVQTTSGAILLYHADLFRLSHSSFYAHTDGPAVIDLDQAVSLVQAADPDFSVGWVGADDGIIAVGNTDFTAAYAIDPGTGRINGSASLTRGVLGLLVNVHDCAFGCVGYTGGIAALNGNPPLLDITWAAVILGGLGLLLILLAVSGAIIWWPSLRRMSHGFRVRWRKGGFARDRDLHNVIGIISVPFLLLWGITGATLELPAVKDAWLVSTGGKTVAELADDGFTPRQVPPRTPPISVTEATDAALRAVPGRLAYLMLPAEGADYYRAAIASGYSPYAHRAFYSGDIVVYVNSHDATDISVTETGDGRPVANKFYDKIFEPAHFGWLVNGWWRILWLLFGLAPLALAVTGLSTWLFKRRTRRRKRAA